MTNDEVIQELYRRNRTIVPNDDPVLVIVALAEIILESQSDVTAERVSVIASGFERTAEKTANSIVETLNKAVGILQLQLNEIEAYQQKITLPELLNIKYPTTTDKNPVESSMAKFHKEAIVAGIFSLGAIFAFLICGFMWVFLS